MTIAGVDVAFGLLWLVRCWSPGEVISANLNVVVCEFAQLVIIHTEQLSFFRSPEVQPRDEVDGVSEKGGDNESIGSAGHDVSNLDVKLLVVVVEPSTSDSVVDTIETNDVVCAEKCIEDESDHASDAVLSEHVHTVINSDPELDCKLVSA